MTATAARPRLAWRPVDGILLLDKPVGLSSNQALQRARRLYRAAKGGHTGSLDPLASGVLPLCFGEATKVAGGLLDADKSYRATLSLGARTASGDRDGEVLERRPVATLEAGAVGRALDGFLGERLQVPPMYSALKQGGEALYKLARRGVVVAREPRPIRILSIGLVELGADWLTFDVSCSKGTYVRTLGEDVAAALDTVGHLSALRRTAVGGALAGRPAHTFEALASRSGDEPALDALLLPVDAALAGLVALTLDAAGVRALRHGQPVAAAVAAGAALRLYAPDGRFLGVGEGDATGQHVRPTRLLRSDGN